MLNFYLFFFFDTNYFFKTPLTRISSKLSDLTTEQIVLYLRSKNLNQSADTFLEQGVNRELLLDLKESELKKDFNFVCMESIIYLESS